MKVEVHKVGTISHDESSLCSECSECAWCRRKQGISGLCTRQRPSVPLSTRNHSERSEFKFKEWWNIVPGGKSSHVIRIVKNLEEKRMRIIFDTNGRLSCVRVSSHN